MGGRPDGGGDGGAGFFSGGKRAGSTKNVNKKFPYRKNEAFGLDARDRRTGASRVHGPAPEAHFKPETPHPAMPAPLGSDKKLANTIPVLRKAIGVFEAVARGTGDTTTKSLAANLEIAPSSCYRILQTFVAADWIRPRAGGTFELSFGLVPLMHPLLRHEVLIETVREPLGRLARTTGLTAKLTVRQGDDTVTIHSAQSPRPHAIASRVGAVVSVAIGSSGAAYLGALPDEEVLRILEDAPDEAWKHQKREHVLRRVRDGRRQGYFADHGSYQPNIHTLSVPLHGRDRSVVGALTLLGFPQDFETPVRAALVRELKACGAACDKLILGLPEDVRD